MMHHDLWPSLNTLNVLGSGGESIDLRSFGKIKPHTSNREYQWKSFHPKRPLFILNLVQKYHIVL